MPLTYDRISTGTLGSPTATLSLSSFTTSYTDIRIVISAQFDGTTEQYFQIRYNNNTTGNYQYHYSGTTNGALFSDGFSSATSMSSNIMYSGTAAHSCLILDIYNYQNANTYKTLLYRSMSIQKVGPRYASAYGVGNLASASAVTSVQIASGNNSFSVGTIYTVYGILRA